MPQDVMYHFLIQYAKIEHIYRLRAVVIFLWDSRARSTISVENGYEIKGH